jgi:hypothetical protein
MMNRGPGFFAAPLPLPTLPSATCLSFSAFLCCRSKGGGGMGVEANGTTASWALYKSFNTLYCIPLALSAVPHPSFSSVPVTLLPLSAALPPSLLLPLQLQITASASLPAISPEAEFLDVIGAKVSRVFLFAIHSHLN